MASDHLTFALADAAATEALGADLAPALEPGMRVYLRGELGAGKTTFSRGLLRALGHEGKVRSPTYALVEIYVFSAYILYHFDFYRFSDAAEFHDAGLDEYFNERSVCLVEWPDKAQGVLPAPDLSVQLVFDKGSNGDSRSALLEALSVRGERCLDALRRERATPRSH